MWKRNENTILCLKKIFFYEFGGHFKRAKKCPNGPKVTFLLIHTFLYIGNRSGPPQLGVVLVLHTFSVVLVYTIIKYFCYLDKICHQIKDYVMIKIKLRSELLAEPSKWVYVHLILPTPYFNNTHLSTPFSNDPNATCVYSQHNPSTFMSQTRPSL